MLVEIAGIDGCGKSTLIDSLLGWTQEMDVFAYGWVIRSPIRRMIESMRASGDEEKCGDIGQDAAEFAVCTDLIREVNSAPFVAKSGQLVFVDNYVRGWLANAVQSRATIVGQIAWLYKSLVQPPILSLEMSVAPDIALQRILCRAKRDPGIKTEGVEFLHSRNHAFTQVRNLGVYPSTIIDAESTPEAVFADVKKLIRERAGETDPELMKKLI